jgi:hypothetical protein
VRWFGVGVAVVAVAVVVWLARPAERPRSEREATVVDEPAARAPRIAPEPASEQRAPRSESKRTKEDEAAGREHGKLAIAGRVLDSDEGGPVVVTVFLTDAEDPAGRWIWSAGTDSKGRFRTESLAPGRYHLGVRIGAGEHAWGRPPRELQVAEAGDENVVIRMRPVTWITYHLVDATTREPVHSERREVWVRGDEKPRAVVSGGGIATIPMRSWFERGTRLTLRAKAEGYHPTEWIDVQLDPRDQHRELTFHLEPDPGSLVEVELLIRDDRGDPVPRITIVRTEIGTGTKRVTENGRVVLRLPAGKNRLRFGPLTEGWRMKHDPYALRIVELDVKRGGMMTVPVVLQRGGWLKRPRWEKELLVRDVRVTRDGEEMEIGWVWFEPGDQRTLLAPGKYVVAATARGTIRLHGEVTIEAGETTQVELHPK